MQVGEKQGFKSDDDLNVYDIYVLLVSNEAILIKRRINDSDFL